MDDATLHELYAAYSSQDLPRLLDLLSDDVDWPDGSTRLSGKEEVRQFWEDQWRRTRTVDLPSRASWLAGDVVVVRIDQTVRSVDGDVLSRGVLAHVLHTTGDLVRRLDIVPLDPAPAIGADATVLAGVHRG